jgi:hypothetical protein
MLNFLNPKSRLVLSFIVFTVTSTTALVSPVRAEKTTIDAEKSTYLSPIFDSRSQELVDLLNSDDLKFSLLEQTYDFTPSVLQTNSSKTDLSFTQANQYSVQENVQISEFEQLDDVDFAFIFDFAQ